MSDLNKVILIGRLTAKPELRFTPGGVAVATLRVANSQRFKTKTGEDKEESVFIDVVVWKKRAEECAEHLEKGQRVLVEGQLTMRQWKTQADEKRTTYEIKAFAVTFLEKSKGSSSAGVAGNDGPPPVSDNDLPMPSVDDDDAIPF